MLIEPKEGEETPIETVPLEVKNAETGDGTPKTEVTEEKVLTPEEIKTLQKKAADFDGITERLRLDKLKNKEVILPSNTTNEAILSELAELRAKLESNNAEKKNDNLKDAYALFVAENPWANADEYFDKIIDKFSANGLDSKEQFVDKLQATAISLFPKEYTEHKEKAIKAKALAEVTTLNNGGGSSASINKDALDINKQKTEEELHSERLALLLHGHVSKFLKM